MPQDTTEFTYQREHPDQIGITHLLNCGKDKYGGRAMSVRTTDAFEPGHRTGRLAHWDFRRSNSGRGPSSREPPPSRRRSIRRTFQSKQKESYRWLENMRQTIALLDEPARCIHVGDRESNIHELFCNAHELGTHLLVRSCVGRLAGGGKHTTADEMNAAEISGLHEDEVRDNKGNLDTVVEIKYRRGGCSG